MPRCPGKAPAEVGVIPKEVVTRLAATGGREAEIRVPAGRGSGSHRTRNVRSRSLLPPAPVLADIACGS